jgi:hypothetical protein
VNADGIADHAVVVVPRQIAIRTQSRCVFGDQRQVWMGFLIRRMLFGHQRGSRGECRTGRQSNIALLLVSNSGMDVQNDDSGVQIVTIMQALSLGSDVNRIFRAVVELCRSKHSRCRRNNRLQQAALILKGLRSLFFNNLARNRGSVLGAEGRGSNPSAPTKRSRTF